MFTSRDDLSPVRFNPPYHVRLGRQWDEDRYAQAKRGAGIGASKTGIPTGRADEMGGGAELGEARRGESTYPPVEESIVSSASRAELKGGWRPGFE